MSTNVLYQFPRVRLLNKKIKMENSIKFIRIPLILTGVDIFNKSNQIWNTILRFCSYFIIISHPICFLYSFTLDKELDFADRVFLSIGSQAEVIIIVQLAYFWHHRDQVIKIFEEMEKLHMARDEDLVQVHAQPLFTKCSKLLYKLCK